MVPPTPIFVELAALALKLLGIFVGFLIVSLVCIAVLQKECLPELYYYQWQGKFVSLFSEDPL